MAEKKLTDYQVDIIETILHGSVKVISYRKPQMNLGDFVKGKSPYETSEALRSLENDFGVLALDPKLSFGLFNRCGYRVDLDKVREIYDSYIEEEMG